MPGSLSRRELALVTAFFLAIMASARADSGAEGFAQRLIDDGFAILHDDSVPAEARRAKFHAFILPYVEGRRTALFTLGVYRRSANDDALERFVGAFTEYSTAIYETHLEDYKSATLKVVSSVDNKPGDVTVMTSANDASLREPVMIGFRLVGGGNAYKIIDVQVAGIWLSIEQRDQFGALLARNNGDVAALAAELEQRAARIRAAKTS